MWEAVAPGHEVPSRVLDPRWKWLVARRMHRCRRPPAPLPVPMPPRHGRPRLHAKAGQFRNQDRSSRVPWRPVRRSPLPTGIFVATYYLSYFLKIKAPRGP